ncbi:MAG: S-layer homology domain-containing protein, partial [Ruminococcaceae bacterium]|nr:S-layer homology domain-containing protein [Oscillospiraceae bacterium]
MKNITKVLAVALSGMMVWQTGALAEYEWARDAVTYCVSNGILSGMENGDLALGNNLTREQMAKIMVDSFGLKPSGGVAFSDVFTDRWSYMYIQAFSGYMKKKANAFNPTENVTREEFVASLVLASGLKEGNIRNPGILNANFHDSAMVDKDYNKLVSIAVERGYYLGSNQYLRPKDLLTRAEACSLLYRVLGSKTGAVLLDLGVAQSTTPIIGVPACSLEQAKAWAASSGAH